MEVPVRITVRQKVYAQRLEGGKEERHDKASSFFSPRCFALDPSETSPREVTCESELTKKTKKGIVEVETLQRGGGGGRAAHLPKHLEIHLTRYTI